MKRGFTLIELLVVISIISLLSSVLLASLQTARKKAREAAIKAEMVNFRSAAELAYGVNSYVGLCTPADGWPSYPINDANRAHSSNANVDAILASIYKRTNQIFPNGGGTVDCYAPYLKRPGWWLVATLGTSHPEGWNWCVDSNGNSRRVSGWSSGWIDCNGGSIW